MRGFNFLDFLADLTPDMLPLGEPKLCSHCGKVHAAPTGELPIPQVWLFTAASQILSRMAMPVFPNFPPPLSPKVVIVFSREGIGLQDLATGEITHRVTLEEVARLHLLPDETIEAELKVFEPFTAALWQQIEYTVWTQLLAPELGEEERRDQQKLAMLASNYNLQAIGLAVVENLKRRTMRGRGSAATRVGVDGTLPQTGGLPGVPMGLEFLNN